MQAEYGHRFSPELEEINEKQRKDVMKALEPYGKATLGDMGGMSESERTKWFFWNMHENLDALRKLEPALVGQIMRTQFTVCDGQSMWTERCGLEKRLELSCKWQLLLKDGTSYQAEESFAINEGWIDLFVGNGPPPHPVLQENQKGYLDSDSPLYPNQLFLYAWISDGMWQEIKPQLYSASANSHTDIYVRDNFMFPVKPNLQFVSGPTGSIGITNLEFRTSSHGRLNTWVKG